MTFRVPVPVTPFPPLALRIVERYPRERDDFTVSYPTILNVYFLVAGSFLFSNARKCNGDIV